MERKPSENVVGFEFGVTIFMYGFMSINLQRNEDDCEALVYFGSDGFEGEEYSQNINIDTYQNFINTIIDNHNILNWEEETDDESAIVWESIFEFEDETLSEFQGFGKPKGFDDVINLIKPIFPQIEEICTFITK